MLHFSCRKSLKFIRQQLNSNYLIFSGRISIHNCAKITRKLLGRKFISFQMDIWSFFGLRQRTKTRLALCLFALELTLSAIEQKWDGKAEEVRRQKKKGKNLSCNSRPPEREGDVAIKVKRPAILWYSALLRARREASLATRSSGRKRVTKSEDLKTTLDGLRSRRRRDEEKVSYFCQRSWLVCWTFSSIWKCCRFMKRDIWFRVSKDVFFSFLRKPGFVVCAAK